MRGTGLRYLAIAMSLVLTLALVNWQIWRKETLIAEGTTMLLRLAPRDPRSLLQGDYMRLRYRLARVVERALDREQGDGEIVVRLDANHVADFDRVYSGGPLAPGEHRLDYRWRGDGVRLAADSFFFEEGRDQHFADAVFGELRVGPQGEAVLVGLRNAQHQPL